MEIDTSMKQEASYSVYIAYSQCTNSLFLKYLLYTQNIVYIGAISILYCLYNMYISISYLYECVNRQIGGCAHELIFMFKFYLINLFC